MEENLHVERIESLCCLFLFFFLSQKKTWQACYIFITKEERDADVTGQSHPNYSETGLCICFLILRRFLPFILLTLLRDIYYTRS